MATKKKKKVSAAVIHSVRFREDQWLAVTTRAKELGIPPGILIRNAALKAVGHTTESEALRRVADAIDGVEP